MKKKRTASAVFVKAQPCWWKDGAFYAIPFGSNEGASFVSIYEEQMTIHLIELKTGEVFNTDDLYKGDL